ncbi:WD40 repeat-like protein [Martensiomyces pterosporus]|nr:WD40 repeat-like protein [Martensiomyces pterosporus]
MQLVKVSTLTGHRAKVTCLAAGYDARGGLLVSGSEDKTCRLWDSRTNKAVSGILGFASDITAVDFAGANGLVAACDSAIYVYDQRSMGVVASATKAAVSAVAVAAEIQAISTRGDFIAYVDEDGQLGVFDCSEEVLAEFAGKHDALAACVAFHPQNPEIASGGFDRQALVWDMAGESVKRKYSASVENVSSGKSINPPFVYALDFSPMGDGALITGHADGRIMCFKDEAPTICWLDCHSYSISALRSVWSNPDLIATAGLDRTLKIWDADELADPAVENEEEQGDAAVFSEDQPVLASVSLSSKPDTLATSFTSPIIYTDQESDIVAYSFA